MPRAQRFLLPLLFLSSLPGAAAPSMPEARAAIADASRRFSAAMVAGLSDEVAGFYTDDAVLLPPGKVVRGREAIRDYFAPRKGRTQLGHEMKTEELAVDGGLAIDSGSWTSTWREGQGEPQTARERYLIVWRRQANGSWKIGWDMWHRPPAEPAAAPPASPAALAPELAALQPFVGKTWKGLVNAERKQYDVSRWEVALGGRAVRILHSVADGVYGGESLVRWDADAREIVYDYVTTAGFSTRGTMKPGQEGRLECHEKVIGLAGGIRELKVTFEPLGDGRMQVTGRMLRGTEWEERPKVVYETDPSARVVLP